MLLHPLQQTMLAQAINFNGFQPWIMIEREALKEQAVNVDTTRGDAEILKDMRDIQFRNQLLDELEDSMKCFIRDYAKANPTNEERG